MRAMQITALDEPLSMRDVPRPTPGPGEVLIKVHACGLNFADTLLIRGKYQEKPALPATPGMEVCGVVEALGPNVENPIAGARVAAHIPHGGLAEFVAASAASCALVPEAMSDSDAAGFLVAYATSHLALAYKARLQPGETLAVLGAAGGVGLTAVEIGALMGAQVIAVAREEEKRAIAEAAGAWRTLTPDGDLRAKLKALGGVDVLYDPVGGAAFDAAFRACNREARILPLGFASGDIPQIPANILLVKNMSVFGFYLGGFAKRHPAIVAESIATLFAWFEAGRLRPHVSHELALEDANAGLDLIRARKATGKVVVRIAEVQP